ncbi:MAG: sulfite exporter TauE/SafE family protein [Chloroflexi bacterium]|nr:sulfite exporter TauE/SafE family protein [Chloroflexota bacterium]
MPFLIFIIALLYASVGHGGGSGYLALMGLFNTDPTIMKPIALGLNIIVTSIGSYKYTRAGHFRWRLFLPFALTSIPLAFLGGRLNLDGAIYKGIVGIILIYAATRIFIAAQSLNEKEPSPPPIWAALLSGAIIGFLSGITGVGGAIFLGPLILLMGWTTIKEAAALSSMFVLVNSLSGFVGHWSSNLHFPPQIIYWGIAVLIGGWIGAEYGSKKLPSPIIKKLLAIVLFLGGIKMLFSALG